MTGFQGSGETCNHWSIFIRMVVLAVLVHDNAYLDLLKDYLYYLYYAFEYVNTNKKSNKTTEGNHFSLSLLVKIKSLSNSFAFHFRSCYCSHDGATRTWLSSSLTKRFSVQPKIEAAE